MWRYRREEVQNELDIVRRHSECCVCGAEVGGGEGTSLNAISRAWNAEEAVGLSIDSCYD